MKNDSNPSKFEDAMKKLYRAKERKIGGICSGLGQYFGIDPTLIRLLFIFLCIFTAVLPMVIAYLIGCWIIPNEPAKVHHKSFKRFYRSVKDRKIGGICGGLAAFFKLDSTIVRLVWVFVWLITGVVPLLVAYLVGMVLIPEQPRKEDVEIEI